MSIPKIKQIITDITKKGRNQLMEYESKLVLREMGIPFPDFIIANNFIEVQKAASKIGYPVVLKIMSPELLHKSDSGGVILNIQNLKSLKQSYRKLISNMKERKINHKRIMVTKMEPKSVIELILGVSYNEQFGHIIMVGTGGVFVEILKDFSIRLIPIDEVDADEMLKELKAYPVLQGYRTGKKVNLNIVKDLMLKVSDLILEFPLIKEIDLNPVAVYQNRISVLDARIIVGKPKTNSS